MEITVDFNTEQQKLLNIIQSAKEQKKKIKTNDLLDNKVPECQEKECGTGKIFKKIIAETSFSDFIIKLPITKDKENY